MEASAHLDLVQAALEALLAREPVDRPDVRALARATGVLPVYYDWTAVGGIRCSDGEILWVDYDRPYPAQRIDEQRLRNMMLFRAHLEYPALGVLTPARPMDSRTCSSCRGTGILRIDGVPVDRAICYCGGLGWLPGTEPDAFECLPADAEVRQTSWRARLRRLILRFSRQATV